MGYNVRKGKSEHASKRMQMLAAADNRGTARRFTMDSERRQTDNTSGDRNGGWNLKQYVVIALVVFITFCCCILFFFMIYRYNGFADFWKKLTTILQPIIMGLVLAYLLNPVMKFLERHLMKLLEPRMKSKTKAKKMSRGVAIAGAWVFLGGIVVLLIAANCSFYHTEYTGDRHGASERGQEYHGLVG